jgi:hypothetical protein
VKVFEKRFPDIYEVMECIESAGWTFVGRKGVFRNFDKYVGSSISKPQGAETYSEGK